VPVAEGPLDNIKMSEPGKFTELTVERTNEYNGQVSDYTLTFTASIPIYDGDIFYLNLPEAISPPREPTCIENQCIEALSCNSERGRIVIEFTNVKSNCLGVQNSEFSFTVQQITNAPTMVESEVIGASWKSKLY